MQKLVFRNPNGEEIDFTSGDFGVTKWEGFSHVDMDVQSQQVPFNDGSVFLDALLGERDLSITVAINDDGDLEKRYRLKRELIHCLNPKLGEGELIYTNDYTSKKIVCVPAIPEFGTKNINDSGSLKGQISFTASSPYWEDVEETIVPFSLFDNISVNNNGDVPCEPKIELYGDNIKKPILRNITTQKEVSLSGNYTGAISYNFQFGKKEIKFGALAQKVKNLEPYNMAYYPSIAEGNGVIVISGITSYFSHDGYNYNVIHNLTESGNYDVSLAYVHYSTNFSCFFATKGSDGGIYKSTDGNIWEKISDESVGLIIEINNALIGITIDSQEIKKSLDGGETWSVVYTASEPIKSIAGNNSIIIAVSNLYLYSSDDLGETWEQSPIPQNYGQQIIWQPESESFFLACEGTFKSSDGISWNQIWDKRILALFYNPTDEKLYAITYEYSQYKAYNSNDIGETWESLGNAFCERIVYWSTYSGRAIGILTNKLRLSYNIIDYEEIIFPVVNSIAVAEEKGIILGDNYYYKNGSWYKINIPSTFITSHCCYGNGVYLVKLRFTQDISLYYSIDDCQTWSEKGIPNDMVGRIAYNRKLSKFFCGRYSSSDGINWSKTTDEDVYDIFYFENQNGSWLYATPSSNFSTFKKSIDGITWTDTGISSTNPFHSYICYCDKQNLVYMINGGIIHVNNPETNIYTQINFITGEMLRYLAWSNELNMFVGCGGVVEYGHFNEIYSYISYDGINWKRIPSSILSEYIYVKFLNSFIGTGGTTIEFAGEENIINALTEDSNMDFNLKNGNNQIRWSSETGTGIGIISYTQKYLGV